MLINKPQCSDVIEQVKGFLQFMIVLGNSLGQSEEAMHLCKKQNKQSNDLHEPLSRLVFKQHSRLLFPPRLGQGHG